MNNPMVKRIDSNKNQLVKWIKKLQTKAKFRREEGLYIVEGYKQVEELAKSHIHTLVYSKESDIEKFDTYKECVQVFVPSGLFKDISTDPSPQGVLAVVTMKKDDLFSHSVDKNDLYLALDGIQDPGNLGTMIRVADAAGAKGILLSKDTVDLYNPKVVKSTMGSMKHIMLFELESLVDGLVYLKDRGVTCFGAYLDNSKFHFHNDYTGPTCFVIGNEGNGISDEIIQICDQRVKIPMLGQAESLNASIAASVLLYEAVRQRLP